jgi:hypothetical protein
MDRPPLARQESSSTSSIEQARVRNHDDVLCPHQQRKKERKNINLRELLMPNFKPLLKKKKKEKRNQPFTILLVPPGRQGGSRIIKIKPPRDTTISPSSEIRE